MCCPSQTPHLTMSSTRIDPPKRVLGLKEGVVTPPPFTELESSSTGSSFPADSAKPVPLAMVSLDSRQGDGGVGWSETSNQLAVQRITGETLRLPAPCPKPKTHLVEPSCTRTIGSPTPTLDDPVSSPWTCSCCSSTLGPYKRPTSESPRHSRFQTKHSIECKQINSEITRDRIKRSRSTVVSGQLIHPWCCGRPALGRLSPSMHGGTSSFCFLGPDRHAHSRTLLRRSRSVGCAPVRDPANQLPCALRVYSPFDWHTCQTPWSVFQNG
ncbi:unnamed protein product [Brassica rapa subsp. narinosa]